MTTHQRISNRVARTILGIAFSLVAFVIEWRVVRAIRKGQLGAKRTEPVLAATRTAEGVEVAPEQD